MPKVVVYVAAAHWKELELQGIEPAGWVREAVLRALSERGSTPLAGNTVGRPIGGPRSESDTHFKPDPKPTKAEKKGRR